MHKCWALVPRVDTGSGSSKLWLQHFHQTVNSYFCRRCVSAGRHPAGVKLIWHTLSSRGSSHLLALRNWYTGLQRVGGAWRTVRGRWWTVNLPTENTKCGSHCTKYHKYILMHRWVCKYKIYKWGGLVTLLKETLKASIFCTNIFFWN